MKKFIYKGINKEGKQITGEVEALDMASASKLVRKRGIVVISIKPKVRGLMSIFENLKNRIKQEDVTNFTRQFATMVNAGLPVTEALAILRLQSESSLQPIIAKVLADIEDGESLSKSLSKHPTAFSPTYIALIKAGETGGVLDKVLARLADNMEKDQEFKGKVKGALIYPVIIVVGMVVVGGIMMIFVVPRLTSLYTDFGAELPLPTKILVGISNFAVQFWPLTIALVAGAIFGFRAYRKTEAGRRKTDEIYLKLPVVGELQRKVILTELTRTLSLMVGTGVPILEGITVTSGVVGNVVIRDALTDAGHQIEKGFPIAYSFAKHPDAFPYILSQMVAVGEETGKMEEVLSKVSHVFEVESDQKVKTLTASIEPLVMIVLGIGVAFLVIAVILPIYNLTSKF